MSSVVSDVSQAKVGSKTLHFKKQACYFSFNALRGTGDYFATLYAALPLTDSKYQFGTSSAKKTAGPSECV